MKHFRLLDKTDIIEIAAATAIFIFAVFMLVSMVLMVHQTLYPLCASK